MDGLGFRVWASLAVVALVFVLGAVGIMLLRLHGTPTSDVARLEMLLRRSADPGEAFAAAVALSQHGEGSIPAFWEALHDEKPAVRFAAATALRKFGDAIRSPTIRSKVGDAALTEPEDYVRVAMGWTLCDMGRESTGFHFVAAIMRIGPGSFGYQQRGVFARTFLVREAVDSLIFDLKSDSGIHASEILRNLCVVVGDECAVTPTLTAWERTEPDAGPDMRAAVIGEMTKWRQLHDNDLRRLDDIMTGKVPIYPNSRTDASQ